MQTTENLFTLREPLGKICRTPTTIISVYSLEKYVWDVTEPVRARRERRAELRTVEEFQVGPVRHFLTDILRRMAAPYEAQTPRSCHRVQSSSVTISLSFAREHLLF